MPHLSILWQICDFTVACCKKMRYGTFDKWGQMVFGVPDVPNIWHLPHLAHLIRML